MDTSEHHGPAPFSRDPRSLPLYVPKPDDLPFWPEAWTWRVLLTVGAVAMFFAGALLCVVIALGAWLAPS